jgi:hypothetical protein
VKLHRLLLLAIVLILVMAACSAGANPEAGMPAVDGDVAGFWTGLWHGLISPITFVISLFKDSVNIYDVHNSGNWYDFGFMFGASIALGGSSRAKRR